LLELANKFFEDHKIKATCTGHFENDLCFYLNVSPHPDAKINKIVSISKELAFFIGADSIPTFSLEPKNKQIVFQFIKLDRSSFDTLSTVEFLDSTNLNLYIGKSFDGKPIFFDLMSAPHLLIAGSTGSGKSGLLHTILANLANQKCKVYMIDPKGMEFVAYEQIKDFTVSKTEKTSAAAISEVVKLMESRYHGASIAQPIVLVIDEAAELLEGGGSKQIGKDLLLLSQKARAANIHLVIATQRPSSKAIPGDIKANLLARICCKTASAVDSRVTLHVPGAENLMGKGDAIIYDASHQLVRFQVSCSNPTNTVEMFSEED
jgi:DNA segregation ATPase FtsK/SpoIIIE, S-DNA-T family